MSKIIDITYDILEKNILTVYATVMEEEQTASDSDALETLSLLIRDPDTHDILVQDSVTGTLPLKVKVELYSADMDEEGADYIAVASCIAADTQTDLPLQNDKIYKQQEINIERLKDILHASCSYTLTSCVETDRPTRCAVSKTRLMLQPAADYKLLGLPENASLLFSADSSDCIPYSGKVTYHKKSVLFPTKFEIGNDRKIPLPLDFSCEVTLQKKSKPSLKRVVVLKFSAK